MKLSKTQPINQACRGIDFLSFSSSSLSLPAPLDSEASDVSQCKTNVAQRVKEWPALTHTYKTSKFLFTSSFPFRFKSSLFSSDVGKHLSSHRCPQVLVLKTIHLFCF